MKHTTRARLGVLAKGLNVAASVAMVLGMAPTAALADAIEGKEVVSKTPIEGALSSEEIIERFQGSSLDIVEGEDGYVFLDGVETADGDADDGSDVSSLATYPPVFDLRDADLGDGVKRNYVTRVKYQGPWGSCWSFGSTAAAETSILAEMREGTEPGTPNDKLDLAEKHLVWFTYQPLGSYASALNQVGEGLTPAYNGEYPGGGYAYNQGGFPAYATSLYSALCGPVLEEDFPYRNAAMELEPDPKYPDDRSFDSASPDGDWTLPDEARLSPSVAELEETFYLESPATFKTGEDGKLEYVYNPDGVDAIKEQLYNGRGVTLCFCADTSRPNQDTIPVYINPETWAHYTYTSKQEGVASAAVNHAVCIVGWDDTYPKENFLADHQPPADGAFIVKNSWGAIGNEAPHKADWGVDGSGFFYVSYYDHSICNLEAFDFVTPNDTDLKYTNDNGYYVGRYLYDWMPADLTATTDYEAETAQANIFNVLGPATIRTLSTKTDNANTTVTFDLYRLNPGATTPTDGELVWTKDAKFETGGFHRVEVDEPISVKSAGERFGVVVTTKLPDGSYETMNHTTKNETRADMSYWGPTGKEAGLGTKLAYGTAVVNPGESFVGSPQSLATLSDGSTKGTDYVWTDLTEIIDAKRAEGQKVLDDANIPEMLAAKNELVPQIEAIDAQYTKEDGTVDTDNPDYQAAIAPLDEQLSMLVLQFFVTTGAMDLDSNFALQAVDNNPIGLTAAPAGDAMYRLYDPATGEHLYTVDDHERSVLASRGWTDEGVSWYVPLEEDAAAVVYRALDPRTGEHLYTSDRHEYDVLVNDHGWTGEGEMTYAAGTDGTPVYRLYDPKATGPSRHLLTTDFNEYVTLRSRGWVDEGVAFHGLR